MPEKLDYGKNLEFMVQAFRIISIVIFGIYIASTFSLIQYSKFLSFHNLIYIFIVLKYFLFLFIYFFFMLIILLGGYLGAPVFDMREAIFSIVGFSNLNKDFVEFIYHPFEKILTLLPNLITGILSMTVLLIALLILGYLNKGNVNLALWVFFLSEVALLLAVLFGYQNFKVPVINNLADLMQTPLFVHALIAIFYLEAMSQLSYFSTFLIPIKERIKRNTAMISRFEHLTPQEISEKVEEETRERRILEKLSPMAALFTSEAYFGPVGGRKFSMQYLAKLKSYYDFMKEKDPELREKIIGLKTVPTSFDVFVRMIVFSFLKLGFVIGITLALLLMPQAYSSTLLGSRIVELSLIEIYVIYVGTAFLLFYVLSEFLKKV
ncbi:MAG: hypothetical protein ACP6IP_08040 [Candidatus Njordarchaeia archaeon]